MQSLQRGTDFTLQFSVPVSTDPGLSLVHRTDPGLWLADQTNCTLGQHVKHQSSNQCFLFLKLSTYTFDLWKLSQIESSSLLFILEGWFWCQVMKPLRLVCSPAQARPAAPAAVCSDPWSPVSYLCDTKVICLIVPHLSPIYCGQIECSKGKLQPRVPGPSNIFPPSKIWDRAVILHFIILASCISAGFLCLSPDK